MDLDIKITPYKCRTIYLEYRDIAQRKKTVVDFIVKSDILQLTKNLSKDGLTLEEAVHLCMSIFIKVADLYENTHEYFKNYLDGVGTVNDCNNIALRAGVKSCQDEILRVGLSSSYTLNYIYFSLVNNRKKRDLLDLGEILKELQSEKSRLTTTNVGEGLNKLNLKIQEVTKIVGDLKYLNMELDVTDSLRLLDNMEHKLIAFRGIQEEHLKKTDKKVLELKDKIEDTGEKVNSLSDHTQEVVNRFNLIIENIGDRLSREGLRAEEVLHNQKKMADLSINESENVINTIDNLQRTMEEVEDLFINNTSISNLLDTLGGIQTYVNNIQGGIKAQTIMTKEMDEKVRTVEEGLSIIKHVLDSLNAIMREDILINLARANRGIQNTAQGVEAIGNKYNQIRVGGGV